MNFLAHVLLAGPQPGLQVGGFLGDFVKGPLRGDYPVDVEAGILLHRRIDRYCDTLPELRALQQELPPPWRRYGGILTDVIWDHLLARQWLRYHADPLDHFCDNFYQVLAARRALLPPAAQRLGQLGLTQPWLQGYMDWSAIEAVLRRVGNRLRRPVPLEQALVYITPRMEQFETVFGATFPRLQHFASQERRLLSSATMPIRKPIIENPP